MFRAKLLFHPHTTHHNKNSTVPGAYPSSTAKGSGGSDFTRTILLTVDKPVQPIGRSSRNEAKGLFAAADNGFFESPVMSRAHAEVKMILEPHRKIIIRDTNSMHGTFVNGLQLHPTETAELQQGTEVTFGAEVTRGEDIYPAKTFRCEVQWERLRSPSPRPQARAVSKNGSRIGYGVSSEDLEYETNGEEDFEPEVDDNSDDDASSGRSSSPAASNHMSPPCAQERPRIASESHDRSANDSLNHLDDVFEAEASKLSEFVSKRILDCVDLGAENFTPEKSRPRTSTIHNLVNKPQSEIEQLEKSKSTCVIDLDADEPEESVKISQEVKEKPPRDSRQDSERVFINLVKSIADGDEQDLELVDLTSEAESMEEEDPEIEEPAGSQKKQHEKQPESSCGRGDIKDPEPIPPPEVMSSKLSEFPWSGSGSFRSTHEAPSLPPLGKLTPPTTTTRTLTGGSHTHWSNTGAPPLYENHLTLMNPMDSKREFFAARAKNLAKVHEELNQAVNRPALFESGDWWSRDRTGLRGENWVPRAQNNNAVANEEDEHGDEEVGPSGNVSGSTAEVGIEADGGFNNGEDVYNDYCDDQSGDEKTDESMELSEIFGEDVPKTPLSAQEKGGYNKLSIEDMVNHESPEPKASRLASPPPSEKSQDSPGRIKSSSALEEILNPCATPATSPSLKRKRDPEEEDVSAAVNIETGREQVAVDVDRPVKRTRVVTRGTGFFRLATATAVGAFMGGVGVFAALVATAD